MGFGVLGDGRKTMPQGLKPSHFVGVIGPTKVGPFQSTDSIELFRGL